VKAELERDLREMLQQTAAELEWTPVPTRGLLRRARVRRVTVASLAMIAVLAVVGTVPLSQRWLESTRVDFANPGGDATDSAAFAGSWGSTDVDGSSQTMELVRAGADGYVLVIRDDFATACSGAPATTTGTGVLQTARKLVFAQPELACDDASGPRIGTPPQAELADFTLALNPATDELVDSFGVVWRRGGSTTESMTSGGMWPQSTLDEVRTAQERADAGDPDVTWQLDAKLAVGEEPWKAEIFARFIKEELGWEAFAGTSFAGYMYGDAGGSYESVLFIRCAPGQTNPLSDLYTKAPPEIRGCAPTIDKRTYETVGISVAQPGLRGPSGVWIVQRWEILQPKPLELSDLVSPDYLNPRQVEQIPPPSDADVNSVLRAFLRARVDGEGAEQHVFTDPEEPFGEVPLLYTTTGGAPYERFDTERLQGPAWPNGSMEYKVRLFAEDGTVVEQHFHVVRQDGEVGLLYGQASPDAPTVENGEAVPVPYSLLDGEVTFDAAPPWSYTFHDETSTTLGGAGRGSASQFTMFTVAADPLTGADCESGPAPSDAEALVRSMRSNPDIDATDPVAESIGGIGALRIDVTAPGQRAAGDCVPTVLERLGQDDRMRLYLLDLPDGMSARILAIAISTLDSEFEYVVGAATPVLDSFKFDTP
jgi:hypothetical protein